MFFQKIALLHRKMIYKINEILKPFHLNTSDWRVFLYLSQVEQSSLIQICEFYSIDKAILSRNVAKLHKFDFIIFLESQDKREKIISLSPKGKEIYFKINFLIRTYESKILEDLNTKEKQELNHIIDKINLNLETKGI